MSAKSVPTGIQEYNSASTRLPVTKNLWLGYLISLLIALLTGIAAIVGILNPNDIYPTEELRQAFLANDFVTLFIGLPILLVSMWLAWRGKLIGLLFWPGALFYGLYNYCAYLFTGPFNILLPLYLVIVTLSIYTTIGVTAVIDDHKVKIRLADKVPERFAGGVLFVLGSAFMLRAFVEIVRIIPSQSQINSAEFGLLVTDFIICPAWIIGGVLLWRRQALGYVGGTGLLFKASMLFVGVIMVLLLQPLISDTTLLITDILVLFVMGLICFIPFALFVRGVVKA